MKNEELTVTNKENINESEADGAASFKTHREDRRTSKHKGPYILGPTIGEGAFAKVKVATHIHTREKVAIKILDKDKIQDDDDIIRVKKEISILKKLRHKNIIQIYEVMESSRNLYIVMEYCEEKELFDYIVNNKRLDDFEACRIFQEIIDGIEYLHSQCIVHRDLKPENLLLNYNKNIKISDFGLSSQYEKGSLISTPCGTPSYAPPEMLKGEEYQGLFSDIWSCGIILYAMLCGFLPFSESKEEIICQKIMEKDYEIPDFLSDSAVDLLNNILKIDINERYDLEQIKAHPWFNLVTPVLRPGITIGINKIPIDENILSEVETYGFNKHKCRSNLENNKYDSMTTVYYLCLRKHIKNGGLSISDMCSEMYLGFVNDPRNRLDYSKEEIKLKEEAKSNNAITEFFSTENRNVKNNEVNTNYSYETQDKASENVNNEANTNDSYEMQDKAIENVNNELIQTKSPEQTIIENNTEIGLESEDKINRNNDEIIIEAIDHINNNSQDISNPLQYMSRLDLTNEVKLQEINPLDSKDIELDKKPDVMIAPAPIKIELNQDTENTSEKNIKENILDEIFFKDNQIKKNKELDIKPVIISRGKKEVKNLAGKTNKGTHHKSYFSTQINLDAVPQLKSNLKQNSYSIGRQISGGKELRQFNNNNILKTSQFDINSCNKYSEQIKKIKINHINKKHTNSETNLNNFFNTSNSNKNLLQHTYLTSSKILNNVRQTLQNKDKFKTVNKHFNNNHVNRKKVENIKPSQPYKRIELTSTIAINTNRNNDSKCSRIRIKKYQKLNDTENNKDNSMSINVNNQDILKKKDKSKSKVKVIELIAKKLLGDKNIPSQISNKSSRNGENSHDRKEEKILNDSFMVSDSNNISRLETNEANNDDKDIVIRVLNKKFKSIYEQNKNKYNIKDLDKYEVKLSPEAYENNINKNFINKIIHHKTTDNTITNSISICNIDTENKTFNLKTMIRDKQQLKKTNNMKKKLGLVGITRNNPKQIKDINTYKKQRNNFRDVSAYYDTDLYMKNESSEDRSKSRHNNPRNISFSPDVGFDRANRQSFVSSSSVLNRTSPLQIHTISNNNRINFTTMNQSKLATIGVIAEDDEFNHHNVIMVVKDKLKKISPTKIPLGDKYQTNVYRNIIREKEKLRQINHKKIQDRRSSFNNLRQSQEYKDRIYPSENVARKLNNSFIKRKIQSESNYFNTGKNNFSLIAPKSSVGLANRNFRSTKNLNYNKCIFEKQLDIQKLIKTNPRSKSQGREIRYNTAKREIITPDTEVTIQLIPNFKENSSRKNSHNSNHRKKFSSSYDAITIENLVDKKIHTESPFIHHRNQTLNSKVYHNVNPEEQAIINKGTSKLKNDINIIDENEEKLFWSIKNTFYSINHEISNSGLIEHNQIFNKNYLDIKAKTIHLDKSHMRITSELSGNLFKENDETQIHSGPVDFSYVSEYSPADIIDKLTEYLSKNKFTYCFNHSHCLKIAKNGVHFEIEIFRLEETDLFYLKFKKKREAFYYRQLLQNILSEVKIFI